MTKNKNTLLYEVNLVIDEGIFSAYEQWLREHVRVMLTHPGFLDAVIYRDCDSDNTLIVHYTLASKDAMDDYLTVHAAERRDEAIAIFGDRFTATRRILQISDL